MDSIVMTSKARTLDELKHKLTCFKVPDLLIFTVKDILDDRSEIIRTIINHFKGENCKLAIRSSAIDEDEADSAKAGEYHSSLDVSATEFSEINDAIQLVLNSFSRNGDRIPSEFDEIIVQIMVEDTVMSGVIFTQELNTGAPYYVINYDDVSGLTNTITGGDSEYANRTLYIYRTAKSDVKSERFRILLAALDELESLLDSEYLDVEFALTAELVPCLLQVRPISTTKKWLPETGQSIDKALAGVHKFLKTRLCPIPGILGETTVLGQMPDWNPAEMIGRVPKALSHSLYRKLITDDAWREGREEMGYAVPKGQPLMVSLAGQPFIDTRLSFHSFLPANLSLSIGEKLVNAWVLHLKENPHLHDKVEFDVAITTFSFDIDEKIEALTHGVLSEEEKTEYRLALRSQTQRLISMEPNGSLASARSRINKLKQLIQNKSYQQNPNITLLYEMIDSCTKLGTIPFSILARHGFIAKTILLSLQQKGIFSEQDVLNLMASIQTVAGELVDDLARWKKGELKVEEFISIYGHLRPGTYDILSPRYDQNPEAFSDETQTEPREKVIFTMTKGQSDQINKLLLKEGFAATNATDLIDYIKSATAARELGKFVFSRSISDMLELIARIGKYYDLDREEMSNISLSHVLDLAGRSFTGEIKTHLSEIANHEKNMHQISSAIRLPQLLYDTSGVYVIPFQVSHPNFITSKKVIAKPIVLKGGQLSNNLAGKIVLIESADPGYDWIFGQAISGLVTKYGGSNSHMAIRCAEFGIPAAIGCGEQRYDSLQSVDQIILDCASSIIQTL